MHQQKNNNIILLLLVAVVAFLVVIDFVNARRELEQARTSCYASAGKDACEKDVR